MAIDTIKAKRHIDLPDLTKRLLALPDNKTEHLPGYLPPCTGYACFNTGEYCL